MPRLQPLFSTDGHVAILVMEESRGAAAIIDPEPGRWQRYVSRAQRHGCTIQAVLATGGRPDLPPEAPAAVVYPTGVSGERVRVRLGSRIRELPLGVSEAVLRLRGLMIGVVVLSFRGQGELGFVVPDGGALVSGGRLCAAENAEPVPLDDLVPDWSLGIFEEGTVYTTTAPDGLFRRPVVEEVHFRDTTRSQVLRQLATIGSVDRASIAQALGM